MLHLLAKRPPPAHVTTDLDALTTAQASSLSCYEMPPSPRCCSVSGQTPPPISPQTLRTCPCSSCRPLAVSPSRSCTAARPLGSCRSARSRRCPRTSLILGAKTRGIGWGRCCWTPSSPRFGHSDPHSLLQREVLPGFSLSPGALPSPRATEVPVGGGHPHAVPFPWPHALTLPPNGSHREDLLVGLLGEGAG